MDQAACSEEAQIQWVLLWEAVGPRMQPTYSLWLLQSWQEE